MNHSIIAKLSIIKLALVTATIALAAAFACTSEPEPAEKATGQDPAVIVNNQDFECPKLVQQSNADQLPQGPPPSLPNLFSGTAYVNGVIAPQGESLYVKLTTSRSHPVKILENGKFHSIIHGPVSDLDREVPFVFCLGDPEGVAVKSNETFEFEDEPFLERDVELNFPMLPKN